MHACAGARTFRRTSSTKPPPHTHTHARSTPTFLRTLPSPPCSARFEQLVKPLLDRTVQPCHNCMKDAGVQPADVHEVLLVGGMTRMPKVRRAGEGVGVGLGVGLLLLL